MTRLRIMAVDGDALLAEQLGEVVGVEDKLAGTFFRAQQRDHGPVKDGRVAHAGDIRVPGHVFTAPLHWG